MFWSKVSSRLADFVWFCVHWHPFSVRWNSPRMIWNMAMKRERIRAAVLESHKMVTGYEMQLAENARIKWDALADMHNQWDSLGQDEKDELINDERFLTGGMCVNRQAKEVKT